MMAMAPLARGEVLRMASMDEDERRAMIARMSPDDLLKLDSMFEAWASDGQLPPSGDGWRTWLMMAGRGFGKTRAGAEWVHRCAMAAPGRRIALVAGTIDEARLVMVDGQSGLKSVAARRGVRLVFEAGAGLLRWPNGSVARLFSGENPEGLRGPEHHIAWFFTFEVVADEVPPSVEAILEDATSGVIVGGQASAAVDGFALYGDRLLDSIETLCEIGDVACSELPDGRLFANRADQILLSAADYRWVNSVEGIAGNSGVDRREMVPTEISLRYYDAQNDFSPSIARAGAEADRRQRMEIDAACSMNASDAKSKAFSLLRSRRMRRLTRELHLPARLLTTPAGSRICLEGETGTWRVERATAENMRLTVSVRREISPIEGLVADAGRIATQTDRPIGPTVLRAFELPPLGFVIDERRGLSFASTSLGDFRPIAAAVDIDGQPSTPVQLWRKAVAGNALAVLPAADPLSRDDLSTIDIALIDEKQLLHNADASALSAGANLAVLGDEILQFARASNLGGGVWRLSGLYRGLRGTEYSVGKHQMGEAFLLLRASDLSVVALPPDRIGALIEVTATGLADDPLDPPQVIHRFGGRAYAPPPPGNLVVRRNGGNIEASWIGRSWETFAWTDDGRPAVQSFAVEFANGSSSTIVETSAEAIVQSEAALGFSVVEVRVATAAGSIRSPAAVATMF